MIMKDFIVRHRRAIYMGYIALAVTVTLLLQLAESGKL
jgi:hypothetical protein